MSIHYTAQAAESLNGSARVPGDKSISHRSVMLGSIADGTTEVSGFLSGDDAIATIKAFRDMGVKIEHTGDHLLIEGVGMGGLQAPKQALNLGNSGTAMRLMMGLLAGQDFDATLTGDASLSSRPMRRISDPLGIMGAKIESQEGCAPLLLRGGQDLKAVDYTLPMASAQVKSAVLLAGLYAKGTTCVIEPSPTRDHTERMLRGFGYEVEVCDLEDHGGRQICLQGGGYLNACSIDVPADISSAAFFMVGTAIAKNSRLTLNHVGVNPTRIGIIEILKKMGAQISLSNKRLVGGEPVADIEILSSTLHGIDIPEALVPLAIDEIPVLAIAAACAKGVTRLSGAEELRVKESDRIAAVVQTLTAMGIDAKETPDGFVITGKGADEGSSNNETAIFEAATVESFDDHRIAMAASIASLRAKGPITIKNCDNISTSFPDYIALANSLGMRLSSASNAS